MVNVRTEKALENKIPTLDANVKNQRFGGNGIIFDLSENDKTVTAKITKLSKEGGITKKFKLDKYEESIKQVFRF
jgi:hypothetical protein